MIEIAGLVLSGISLLNDLVTRYQDAVEWGEGDLEVDREWLPLALSKGQLDGKESDYAWVRENRVPTVELRGTARVVIAYNQHAKVRYRICRGRADDRMILMRSLAGHNA